MAVLAVEDIRKDTKIGSLKLLGAKVKKGELSESSQFFCFKRVGPNEMVMLGPASFINHNCQPNCEYICRGEKSSTIIFIRTKRALVRGEEITVSYSDDNFGPGKNECNCSSCNDNPSNQTLRVETRERQLRMIHRRVQQPLPSEVQYPVRLTFCHQAPL